MATQKFKGDTLELQMEAAGEPAITLTSTALDAFYDDGYEASPFLLMLYDEGRMPFSDRIPRDSFVEFIKEALTRFRVSGTFDSYLFILRKVFGEGSEVLFDVIGPGKLGILISATTEIAYDGMAQEYSAGVFSEFELIDTDGNNLVFRSISGIDSAYKLQLLLAELIPTGIYTEIELSFFTLSEFIADESGTLYGITDDDDNQIVFFETGE